MALDDEFFSFVRFDLKGNFSISESSPFVVGANGMETKEFSGQAAADNVKRGQ